MKQRHHTGKSAAFFSWRDRGSTEAKLRHNRPSLEHLESRRLLATITEFAIPSGTASAPAGITSGPNGSLWFTEFGLDMIGTINPSTHAISEFPVPTPNAEPRSITLGPDGNLWFTEFGASQIGMINPTTDKITEFPLPTANAQPFDITAGPDDTIWFTEMSANQIGRIDIATGKLTSFAIPTSDSVPEGITLGSDGNIWFTESLGNNIGMINTHTGANTLSQAPIEIPLLTASAQPYAITTGPGGNLWFTEFSGNRIGEYNLSTHLVSEFKVPTPNTQPTEIVAAPDGSLWFTQSNTNEVGVFNPATSQAVTEIATPSAISGPRGITIGSDGATWFTEFNSGRIATTAPSTHVVVTSPPPTKLSVGANFGLTVNVDFDSGAVDTGYQGSVTVTAIGATSSSGSALAGTTTVMATNGVASFTGLSLNVPGSYTIAVNAAGEVPASIGPIVVTGVVVPPPIPPLPPPPRSVPILTSDHLIMAGSGKNRYVAGIVLTFSAPLDAATARNSANYTVIQAPSGGRAKAVKAVHLRAIYKPSSKTVRLTFAGKPRFTAGGQLIVNGSKPNGLASPAGVHFQGNMGYYSGSDGSYEIFPGPSGIDG